MKGRANSAKGITIITAKGIKRNKSDVVRRSFFEVFFKKKKLIFF